jgi:hypothetical protein
MAAPPRFPITRLLVPAATRTAPPDLTEATFDLTAGVPAAFPLTSELSLTVVVPTGQVQSVLDADGTAVATSDRAQRLGSTGAAEAIGSVARLPARLVLQRTGTVIGSLPLVAGLRGVFPNDGGTTGAAVELVVLAWTIEAGTLVGPGSFGSRVRLAWRSVGAGADTFEPPPVDPSIVTRLLDPRQAQSTLGAAVQRAPGGYASTSFYYTSLDYVTYVTYADTYDDEAYEADYTYDSTGDPYDEELDY